MTAPDQILGVILAGGRSRRFGAGDKGFADLAGQPVLSHVIARFRPQVGRLVLSVNGDPARFSQFGFETISDEESPELGPLSGLLAAMDWAAQHRRDCTALATVSSDVPFLPSDLVARLDTSRRGDVAISISAGRRHPTIAIWPMTARSAVSDALVRKALSVDRLATDLNAVAVAFPMRDIDGVQVDPFFNINTQDDLATARALLTKATEG